MKEDFLIAAFSRARQSLRAVARRFSSADDMAVDDMLQDAFVRLWTSSVDPRSVDEAEALSRTTVRNLAIDSSRRQSSRRMVPIDEMEDAPDDTVADGLTELYRDVSALIDKSLTQRDREILYRRDRDGWDFDEIAAHYSLTEANVRVIVSRARRTIRSIYLGKDP